LEEALGLRIRQGLRNGIQEIDMFRACTPSPQRVSAQEIPPAREPLRSIPRSSRVYDFMQYWNPPKPEQSQNFIPCTLMKRRSESFMDRKRPREEASQEPGNPDFFLPVSYIPMSESSQRGFEITALKVGKISPVPRGISWKEFPSPPPRDPNENPERWAQQRSYY